MRRLAQFHHLLEAKLYRGETIVDFIHRGGARLDFVLDNIERARGYDVIVVMAGMIWHRGPTNTILKDAATNCRTTQEE